MDKNFKIKVKDFFRKEGFYIVLFLCLCVVATVTAVSYKMSDKKEVSKKKADTELTLNEEDNISKEIPNAQRVQKDINIDKQVANNEETEKSAAVSAVPEVRFNKPIEGSVCRQFSSKPVKYYENNERVTYRTIKGIDIKAAIGTDVKSAADGVVESVVKEANDIGVEDGVNVVILHPNGMRTKYTNLDSNVQVNVGDKVTTGTVLGKVGATATLFKEGFEEHLNLQMIDANGNQINPVDHIAF